MHAEDIDTAPAHDVADGAPNSDVPAHRPPADSGGRRCVAGIELGGTKTVVVLGGGGALVERARIPTTTPDETLRAAVDVIDGWRGGGHDIAAIGIGSFGPVGLDRQRPDYGFVTSTPKPGWRETDVVGHIAGRLGLPIGFDTDVNAAALAEGLWGASAGCDVHVYLTIGTGIGGGVVVGGRPLHGLVHPEHGHVRVRRRVGDDFAGACPFHGDCIEGLAAGPAIAARAGAPAESLARDHPVWHDVAAELGELFAVLVTTLSPQRIVVGGGVGYGQRWLLPSAAAAMSTALGGYVAALEGVDLASFVVPAALGDDAGPLGVLALAEAAALADG